MKIDQEGRVYWPSVTLVTSLGAKCGRSGSPLLRLLAQPALKQRIALVLGDLPCSDRSENYCTHRLPYYMHAIRLPSFAQNISHDHDSRIRYIVKC